MKGDLNDIVAKRNAKLAAKNAPKRVRHSSAQRAAISAQLSAALGPAPAYLQDAVKIASDRAALMLARRGS